MQEVGFEFVMYIGFGKYKRFIWLMARGWSKENDYANKNRKFEITF